MKLLQVSFLVLICYPPSVLSDWTDWWSTPAQQALKLYESGNSESLLDKAPDANWEGIGQFGTGDFEGAAQTFANNRQASSDAGQSAVANTALYNQALSEIMAGQYETALEGLDELLKSVPDHADASHNRNIAQQLLELEQQQENQDSQEGEQGDSNEQNSSDSEQSEGSESSGDSSEPSDSENADNSDEPGDSSSEGEDQDSEADSASEEQEQQDAQDAADALEAEAQQGEQESTDGEGVQAVESEQPLSESEQATEQLLRRIPDDPRGLLRRKLEQSHRSEYPEVRDAVEPW